MLICHFHAEFLNIILSTFRTTIKVVNFCKILGTVCRTAIRFLSDLYQLASLVYGRPME